MIKACHSSPKIPENRSTFYTENISGTTQKCSGKQLGHIPSLLRILVN